MTIHLRYDGKYDFIPGENRQWTLLSHFIDKNGDDRFKGSFTYQSLKELGIVTHKGA